MFPCPHCERPGISFWQKVFMGPPCRSASCRPTICRRCGGRVCAAPGPFRLAALAALPPVAALCVVLVARPAVASPAGIAAVAGVFIALTAVAACLVILLRVWLVPLIRQ